MTREPHSHTTTVEHPVVHSVDHPEEGSTTVEYAIGAVAAAGFAGLLLVILRSDTVRGALEAIIQQALTVS